jgi:hypothetical protein
MAVQRFYIFRDGTTDACAITGTRIDPQLPGDGTRGDWRFWMQISRIQEEHGQYGFDMKAAAADIAARGYSLFTGSQKLLADRIQTRTTPDSQEGTSNA